MTNIKVSVIIPVYNVEKYIKRCIDSVLGQTLKTIEIILVDDGSPDNCGKICDDYAIMDSRISVIHQKNQGLGLARNSGMNIARGEFIAFVDSDDYIEKDMLEIMYNKAKMEMADTCLCNIKNVSGTFKGKDVIEDILIKSIGAKYDGSDYIGMAVWRGIYSRELIVKNQIQFVSEREYISEDIVFDLMYYKHSKCITIVNKMLYNYTINMESLSRGYKANRFEMCTKLYEKEKELLRQQKIYELGIERLNMTYFWNINSCFIQEINYEKENGKKISKENIKKIIKNFHIIDEMCIKKMRFKDKILLYIMKKNNVLSIKLYFKLKINIKKFIYKITYIRGVKN